MWPIPLVSHKTSNMEGSRLPLTQANVLVTWQVVTESRQLNSACAAFRSKTINEESGLAHCNEGLGPILFIGET